MSDKFQQLPGVKGAVQALFFVWDPLAAGGSGSWVPGLQPSGGGGGGASINISAGTTSNDLTHLVFSNSNGVSFGLAGATITASTGPQSNQILSLFGLGNTTDNSSTALDARSLSIKAIGSLTVGYSNGSIELSAPNALTTAMRSDAVTLSNINLSAGTTSQNLSAFVFSNSNNVSFGLNGSTVTATATFAQTNQSAIKGLGASNTGNTAGNTGLSTGIDWVLAGSNNITISESTTAGGPNTLWVSGAAAGGAQTGISGIIASDATYTSGSVYFSNLGNITISSSVNGASQYVQLSVAAQSNQSAIKGFGASNTGNTAGNTGLSTGIDWVLAGSNGITISESTAGGGPNTLWVSGTIPAAQTNQTLGFYGIGNTTDNSSTTLDARTVSIKAFGSLTVGFSNGSIELSAPNALTTAALSGDTSKYVQNWKLTGNTAGTTSSAQGTDLWFSGGNSITVSGNSNTIVFSVGNYLTTADLSQNSSKYVQNWKLTGNTAGTTSSAQGTDLWISGGNNITVSGNSNTIVLSVPTPAAQTVQTLGIYASSQTTGGASSSTYDARSLSIVGSHQVSVGWTNGSFLIDATTAAQTNQTVGLYAVSNTEGASSSSTFDARTLSFQGKGAASVGFSNGSIVIDAPNAGAGNVTFSAGANSAGLGSVVFSNSNGVSFGLNGSTITASAAGGGAAVGMSTNGNTTGTTKTISSGTAIIAGSGVITISQDTNGNGVTDWIQAPATSSLVGVSGNSISSAGSTISVYPAAISEWMFDASPIASSANTLLGQSSLYFVPFDIYWPISASRINFFISVATSTNTQNSTGSASNGIGYALYTRMAGTGSDRISLLTSYSAMLISISFSSNTQFNATHYAGLSNATSHTTIQTGLTTSNASTYLLNSLAGYRAVALPVNQTLTPGRYWLGFSYQSTTANQTNMSNQISVNGYTYVVSAYRPFGTSSANSNASVYGPMPGLGTYSAQSAGWPNSIGLTASDIKMPVSVTVPKFNISGISTSSNIL